MKQTSLLVQLKKLTSFAAVGLLLAWQVAIPGGAIAQVLEDPAPAPDAPAAISPEPAAAPDEAGDDGAPSEPDPDTAQTPADEPEPCMQPTGPNTCTEPDQPPEPAPTDTQHVADEDEDENSNTLEAQPIVALDEGEWGEINVIKETRPDHDDTEFEITATGTGDIDGDATRTISDGETVTYIVDHGTYSISEEAMDGWESDTSDCEDLVIDGDHMERTCTIINHKEDVHEGPKLTIIKDASPLSTKEFHFTTEGEGLEDFSLVDDGGNDNTKVFDDLEAGDFSITEEEAEGWDLQAISCTGSDTWDWPDDESKLEITLHDDDDVVCVFKNVKRGGGGVVKKSKVVSFKFNDVDGDSHLDDDEVKMGGWTMTLSASDGNNGWEEIEVLQTNGDGYADFGEHLPGTYRVCETQQDGWVTTNPDHDVCQYLHIDGSGAQITLAFGNQQQEKEKEKEKEVLSVTTISAPGAPAALVDTGASPIVNMVAGITILSALGVTSFISMRRKSWAEQ